MRLSKPELADALAQARRDGVRTLCVLPLAPYSVHVYADRRGKTLAAQRQQGELSLVPVAPFGTSLELVSAHAARIRESLREVGDGAEVVLTAHSLPQGVIDGGDPYQHEFELSARAIGAALGRHVELAYQSQGVRRRCVARPRPEVGVRGAEGARGAGGRRRAGRLPRRSRRNTLRPRHRSQSLGRRARAGLHAYQR